MRKFADRLKELRIDKGLSFEKLSKETKIGASTLCRLENDKADIKSTELIILAKYFDVSTDYLLGLEDWI